MQYSSVSAPRLSKHLQSASTFDWRICHWVHQRIWAVSHTFKDTLYWIKFSLSFQVTPSKMMKHVVSECLNAVLIIQNNCLRKQMWCAFLSTSPLYFVNWIFRARLFFFFFLFFLKLTIFIAVVSSWVRWNDQGRALWPNPVSWLSFSIWAQPALCVDHRGSPWKHHQVWTALSIPHLFFATYYIWDHIVYSWELIFPSHKALAPPFFF